MTYWRNPSFKALQRAWYAELAMDGFEDVEELIGDEMMLKQVAEHPYRDADPIGIETKEEYFRLLTHRAQEGSFQSDVDRIIVTMFAEGAKIKRIVETLQSHGKARCRMTVRMTIRRYEMQWGMREYSPKQLNKKIPRLRTA